MTGTQDTQVISMGRRWLKNCEWRDLRPADVDTLSAADVLLGIECHWPGGMSDFLAMVGEAAR